MHITLLPSWYPTNEKDVNGVFFRDQALALSAHGHKIGVIAIQSRSIVTVLHHNKSFWRFSKKVNDEGVITYRNWFWAAIPIVPQGKYLLWKRAANSLLNEYVLDHGWPDLIHAHSALFAGAAAAEWKARYDLPFVLTEHSSAYARGILRPWHLRLSKHAAQAADALIAVSPFLSNLLVQQLGINPAKCQWIPNIVAKRFNSLGESANKETIRRPIRLLNLALMNTNKGQVDLLEAFAKAFPSPYSTELWLAGDGPLLKKLRAMAETLGVNSRIRFLGLVPPDEVPRLLSQVDVMVVASHCETFGVVVAEALMTGTPVVATKCGGPEYIVREGDGLLVQPRKPEELAEALRLIVKNLSTMDFKTIAKRAHQRFSGEVVAKQLTDIYQQIFAGKHLADTVE